VTRRLRAAALLPAAALAFAVLTGCGHHDGPAGADSGASGTIAPSPPSASELAHMQKLVNDADAAASAAEKDASADR
jgi:hypothetical protein